MPGHGTFFCLDCRSQVSLREDDALPICPGCGGERFDRDSIFEPMQVGYEEAPSTAEHTVPPRRLPPSWLEAARAQSPAGGSRLVTRDEEDGDRLEFHEVPTGWTRIGRSAVAEIRLDDPSVSRRHALIVAEPNEPVRVLDDRSLNGVLVNGERVEWSHLRDGDELTIGRYRLYLLED